LIAMSAAAITLGLLLRAGGTGTITIIGWTTQRETWADGSYLLWFIAGATFIAAAAGLAALWFHQRDGRWHGSGIALLVVMGSCLLLGAGFLVAWVV
jgi:uncharacterized membrane protein